MAWSWSHTSEAYGNAFANLEALEMEEMTIIFAEIEANKGGDERNFCDEERFDQEKYDAALKQVKDLDLHPADLVDAIWSFASEQAICDNGGFNAWLCPYGCHTVSFSKEEESDE